VSLFPRQLVSAIFSGNIVLIILQVSSLFWLVIWNVQYVSFISYSVKWRWKWNQVWVSLRPKNKCHFLVLFWLKPPTSTSSWDHHSFQEDALLPQAFNHPIIVNQYLCTHAHTHMLEFHVFMGNFIRHAFPYH